MLDLRLSSTANQAGILTSAVSVLVSVTRSIDLSRISHMGAYYRRLPWCGFGAIQLWLERSEIVCPALSPHSVKQSAWSR